MGKIHILDEHIINQIAAGEVIERPSSIIKELVENSIDANSSAVTIEIKRGGISFIRVTDNGEGMSMQDALLAFERHATSKINSSEDLNSIHTLGFRGEALASIAAVTQMEMVTRARDNIGGMQIINHGGVIISQKEIGCPEGTTIIVENLFFNTPARLKFLKSPRAETAHISNLISKLILGHPEVSFKYISDGKIIYHSPGDGKLESAILSIYGKEVKDQLLEIDYKDSSTEMDLKGFLGKPSLSRTNRIHQSFFVNGRYVKSQLLSAAVENAYKSYMMINHFPWIVLHIAIPPELVDVNVHPAKTEIRFREEEKITEVISQAVLKAIDSQIMIPEIKNREITEITNVETYLEPQKVYKKVDAGKVENEQISIYTESISVQDENKDKVKEAQKKVYIGKDESLLEKSESKNALQQGMKYGIFAHTIKSKPSSLEIIGRIFSTYVIVQDDDRIFFIDQHAAHERILFEQYKEMFSKQQIISQQLLPPIVLEVTHAEQLILEESLEKFQSLGFEIEPFGGRSYIVRGVPANLGSYDVRGFFQDVLDKSNEIKSEMRYHLNIEDIMQMACKRAVKAKDPLSDIEITALVEKIREEKIPLTCPHGRPIMVSMSRYELEKMFKRVQ